jgi:hypothetical protein
VLGLINDALDASIEEETNQLNVYVISNNWSGGWEKVSRLARSDEPALMSTLTSVQRSHSDVSPMGPL